MNITLYHFPLACSQVTINALERAALDYHDEVVNIFKGEQKSPEYLAIHPGGKVPALVVDGQVMTENAAILMYLNEVAPNAQLLPSVNNAFERCRQRADLIWCSGVVHPMVRQVRMPSRFTDGETESVQKKGTEYLQGVLAQVDARVAGGRWWYGSQWSIVDVYLNWLTTTAGYAEFPLDNYPNVQALRARVQDRPSFKRTQEREAEAETRSGIEFPS